MKLGDENNIKFGTRTVFPAKSNIVYVTDEVILPFPSPCLKSDLLLYSVTADYHIRKMDKTAKNDLLPTEDMTERD